MFDWIHTIMNTLNYPGIAFLMFLEVVFPPIPSEIIMPLAGFTASNGSLNVIGVILAGTVGSMVGAVVFYYLGKIVGTERLVMLADKYGKWLTVSGKDVRKADYWFDRHGNKVVFFCRLVPGIRSLVSIPAGVSEMKLLPFLLYTLVGTLIWNIALTYAGFALGENYEVVDQYMGDSGKIVLGILVVLAATWYTVRLVRQKKEETQSQQAQTAQPQQQTWAPPPSPATPQSWAQPQQQTWAPPQPQAWDAEQTMLRQPQRQFQSQQPRPPSQ
jgi:membrane protein DedA with SNARE-associated domain